MKKLLLAFLLLSTVAFGQPNKGLWRKWVDIPSAPSLTSPVTIIPSQDCCGGAIYNATLVTNSPKHVKTSGVFNRTAAAPGGFSARIWDGVVGDQYTVVNTAGDVYGIEGSTPNGHGVSTNTSGNYINWYGLDKDHPMVVTGENGFQLNSAPGGSVFVVRNVVARNPNASGLTANFPVNGSNFYENINQQFYRSFNAGQEGIHYAGNTTGTSTTPNYINIFYSANNFSYNSSREGTQGEHINLYTAVHNTCILPGSNWNSGGGAGQQNCFQAHDLGPGSSISYSIYDQGVDLWNIFTHGLRVHHDYFSFSNKVGTSPQTYNGFIGRTDNQIWYAASPRMSGDSLIFEYDYFNYTGAGTLDYVTIVEERVAHIIFRNCTFSTNISHIMKDNRVAGYTNTLTGDIGNNGNVSATITVPIWVTGYNDPDNYNIHGLIVTSSPYYALHFGYRTP